MVRICQITGAQPSFGNAISYSHRRTERRRNGNIQSRRYGVLSLSHDVTLRVARGEKV